MFHVEVIQSELIGFVIVTKYGVELNVFDKSIDTSVRSEKTGLNMEVVMNLKNIKYISLVEMSHF